MGIVRLFGWVMYYLRQLAIRYFLMRWLAQQKSYLPSLSSSQQVVAVVIFAWCAAWRVSLEMMSLVSLARRALLGLIFFLA
jgi:hypothetical protein